MFLLERNSRLSGAYLVLVVELEVVVTMLVGTVVDATVVLTLVVLASEVGSNTREVVRIGVLVDVTTGVCSSSTSSSRRGVLGALSWTASILRGGGLALRLGYAFISCLGNSL